MADNILPAKPIPESYWVIPGQLLAGEYPGFTMAKELTRKRLDAFLEAGFNTFINLTCEDEAEDYAALLFELAGYHDKNVECLRFPIGDFGLPTLQEMTVILDEIDRSLKGGRRVYLHCYAGIGRTGTTVGCFLARHGLNGEKALLQLAEWWQAVPKSARFPRSPETSRQVKFVREWV